MFYVQIGSAALMMISLFSLFTPSTKLSDTSVDIGIWGILLFGFVQFIAMLLLQFRRLPRRTRIASLIIGLGTFGFVGFIGFIAAAGYSG